MTLSLKQINNHLNINSITKFWNWCNR